MQQENQEQSQDAVKERVDVDWNLKIVSQLSTKS